MNCFEACATSVASLLAAPLHFLKRRVSTPGPKQRARSHSIARPSSLRSQVDICEFLHQESECLGVHLRSAGMTLELELPTKPLPVLLDRSKMQEVFVQVVDLARSVMSRGSALRVLARIDGAHAVVNLMDAPCGSDTPCLGKWFHEVYAHSLRPDHRDEAAARVAICQQIVGEHHGRLYAAPSPLGSLGITLRLATFRN